MGIKDNGLEVFEARKEKIKQIQSKKKEKIKQIQSKKKENEENYKKMLEYYGNYILKVFDTSNIEQDSDILVWRIKIRYLASKKIRCEVDFTPKDDEKRMFWRIEYLKKSDYYDKVKKVIALMQTIETFECTPTIVKDIGECLKENLDGKKYSIEFKGIDELIISMNEPTISEEE